MQNLEIDERVPVANQTVHQLQRHVLPFQRPLWTSFPVIGDYSQLLPILAI